MNARRAAAPGATRTCPHCRATILASAGNCPACRGHLHYAACGSEPPARATPLHVEGTLQCTSGAAPVEYTMLLTIRDERGVELARHVVGVGAVRSSELRHFTLTVEAADVEAGR